MSEALKEQEKKVAEEQTKEQVPTEQSKELSQDEVNQINWKRFREERQKDRQALNEATKKSIEKEREAAALTAAMESLLSKSERAPQQNEEEETEQTRIARLVREEIDKERKKDHEERLHKEAAQLPQQLNSTFSDYKQVCTEENVDYLEYHFPEIAEGFKHMPNNFNKWSSIYKAIKKLIPNPDSKKDEKKIEKNLSKPQSMSSSGMTHTGDHAPVMTSEKARQDNWARMQRVMKGGK